MWQQEVPYLAGFGSGVLATGGGLLFHGGSDGYFRAFDSKTGEELWRFQTGFGGMRRQRRTRSTASSMSRLPPAVAVMPLGKPVVISCGLSRLAAG